MRHWWCLIIRSQHRVVVFIKEREVLRKPAVRAWSNFGEDVGEIPLSNPVEINSEAANGFQMLTKGIRITYPGDNLIGYTCKFDVKDRIAQLRGNAR